MPTVTFLLVLFKTRYMNARKRPGAALHRPAKQPRLTMRTADGSNPSPGGNPSRSNERLRARWVAHFASGLKHGWSFAQGTVELVVETLFPPRAPRVSPSHIYMLTFCSGDVADV